MIEGSRVGVIIPAAGRGVRMGGSRRKQLIELDGRAVLLRTLDVFNASPDVDLIVAAVDPEDTETTPEFFRSGGISKPVRIVSGGKERQDSVRNCLEAVSGESADLIAIHDAVRPFITGALLHSVLLASLQTGAAIAAVRAKETIKRSCSGQTIDATVPRDELWVAQTPQVFHLSILKAAYDRALETGMIATDDAGLVECLGVKISIVEGDYDNIKITTPEDIALAGLILRRRSPDGRPY